MTSGPVALSDEWLDWVRMNTLRGCAHESMLADLINAGFARTMAESALGEAAGRGPEVRLPRPRLRIRENRLLCHGQLIRVVAELDSPHVVVFDGLLSDSECSRLIDLAHQRLKRSTVVDNTSGESVPHDERSSQGACFMPAEFPLVADIEARVENVLGWPATHGEGLQVLRYGPGDEYRAHFDWFDPEHPGSAPHLALAGQRVGTLVLYLSDVECGGATRFPGLGFEARPQRGGALYFADVNATGLVDRATLHAGNPVISGVKYIATKWLREHPLPT